MSYYNDDDDDEGYIPKPKSKSKMKMHGIMGFLSCTPLKIYLSIALLSIILYYANNMLKGKVDFSNCFSLMCSIVCISLVIMVSCKINFLVAWALAIGFSICSICFAMGKFQIPTKLY